MTLSKLDCWRIADELSVVDIAILITGNDPSQTHDVAELNEPPNLVQTTDYEGYDAAFKALRNAILNNRLRATLAFRARDPHHIDTHDAFGERLPYRREIEEDLYEVRIPYDTLVRASNYSATIFVDRKLSDLHKASTLFLLKEPDWKETTVEFEELKRWLSAKGRHPTFFFPNGAKEGFRDKGHPRYSPKLACAVAAWEAVKRPKKNLSVKATVEKWVRANAVTFGMVGSDDVPTKQAVDQVAAVVNWAPGGGANRTGGDEGQDADEASDPINNFTVATDPPEDDIPS